jgi:hypothetical protein
MTTTEALTECEQQALEQMRDAHRPFGICMTGNSAPR